MDVHKDTITRAVALPGRAQARYRGEIAHTTKAVNKLIQRLSEEFAGEVLLSCYGIRLCAGRHLIRPFRLPLRNYPSERSFTSAHSHLPHNCEVYVDRGHIEGTAESSRCLTEKPIVLETGRPRPYYWMEAVDSLSDLLGIDGGTQCRTNA